jgi:hypothetical protein
MNIPITRIAMVVLALASAGLTPCAAQSRFQNLTPGTSTVEDAIRVLGKPVRNTAAGEMEFAPPAGTSRVIIGSQAGVIDRIEVSFQSPIARSALLKTFGLGIDADARAMTKGRLVEYFGGQNLLAFDYASEDPAPGVTSVQYLSPGRFAIASGLIARSPAEPPGRMNDAGPPPPRVVDSPNLPPPPRNENAAAVESAELPQGTAIRLRLIDPIDTGRVSSGRFRAFVDEPIRINGSEVLPRRTEAVVVLRDNKESDRSEFGYGMRRYQNVVALESLSIHGHIVNMDATGYRQGWRAHLIPADTLLIFTLKSPVRW